MALRRFFTKNSETHPQRRYNSTTIKAQQIKPKTFQEIAREVEVRNRFIPLRKEHLKDPGFALTGKALVRYQHARKQDRRLPDLSVDKVQSRRFQSVFKNLDASYQKLHSYLFNDPDSAPESSENYPVLRSAKLHLNRVVAERLGFTYRDDRPEEAVKQVKWAEIKSLLPPVHVTAPENPVLSILEKSLRGGDHQTLSRDIDLDRPTPAPSGDEEEDSGSQDLAAKVDQQLSDLNQGANRNAVFPSELGENRQTGLYQSIGTEYEQKLNCSAADAIAYYDFYDLKLASSPVWTVINEDDDPVSALPPVLVGFDEEITIEVWNKYYQAMEEIGGDPKDLVQKAAFVLIQYIFWQAYLQNPPITYNGFSLDELIELSGRQDAKTTYENIESFVNSISSINLTGQNKLNEDTLDAEQNYHNYRLQLVNNVKAVASEVPEEKTIFLGTPSTLGYPAKVFAPGSVNYGLLVNYRQKWIPESWQVGELVQTLPLAPKEKRRYTKKTIVAKKRAQKEIDNSLSIRKSDDTTNSRAESQIVQNAQQSTSFDATASGGVQVEVFGIGANAGGSTSLETSAGSDSSESKRKMREAVAKSAREFRSEHRIEVQVDESTSMEEFSENVLTNPNEEITVTYLFYELQRQFSVSEALHNVRSVILVANEVPHWSQIDWAWIKRHDWILKRCLLDDSFKPALDYVLEGQEAMELKLEALAQRKKDLSELVAGINRKVQALEQKESFEEHEMKLFSNTYYSTIGKDDGVIEDVFEFVFGGDEGTQEEEYEARMEGSLDWLDRINQKLKSKQEELTIQRNALDRAIADFNKGVLEKHSKIRQVERLIDHLRDNILYYMKAIWSHEPPDQRYLRLMDKEVLFAGYPADDTDILVRARSKYGSVEDLLPGDAFEVILPPPNFEAIRYRKLVDIADLENLLGFKGNYMIFPLRIQSYATAYMAQNFVGGYFDDPGDPDHQSGINIGNLLNGDPHPVAAVQSQQLFAVDPDPNTTYPAQTFAEAFAYIESHQGMKVPEEIKLKLNDLLQKGLLAPESAPQRIIVPSDSLYIEALPGKHPILEDFKLKHRMIDAMKASAEHKRMELENIRAEARLRSLDFSDPDIDKHIQIDDGDVNVSIDG